MHTTRLTRRHKAPSTTTNEPLASPEPPWVQGTVNDDGEVLRLGDVPDVDILVEVYSHQGVVGESIKLRWATSIGAHDAETSASPPYETPWQPVERANGTLNVKVPKAEAALRLGNVAVSYEVYKLDGTTVPSPTFVLRVEGSVGLEPVTVKESNDGKILLAEIPAEGATMEVARQATVPAGSTIRFFWEGVDASSQPVRGFDEAYDNGHLPTAARLPKADLQRIAGKIAIRYTVDTTTARIRLIRPLEHSESDWTTFDVIGVASYPAPRVIEAAGTDTLVPYAAANGATVAIDADLVATDSVTVSFGTYTSPAKAGARPLSIVVPPGELAKHLGEQVDVHYTVIRGTSFSSEAIALHIGSLKDNDSQLPTPRIDRADSLTRILDLSTFSDDPVALVDPWLLMGAGQTVWLRLDGIGADGKPTIVILYSGHAVTNDDIATGLQANIERSVLSGWKNGSDITVTCKVNFKAGAEAGAVVFQTATYILRTDEGSASGRMYELEDFEDPTSVIANGMTYRLRFATIRPIGGRLQSSSTSRPPYLTGRHGYLLEQLSSVTAEIRLNHAAQEVRLGVRPNNTAFPAQVIAWDSNASEIDRASPTTEGWVRFTADGARRIASLTVASQAAIGVDFDNLLVTTGSPWDVVGTPRTETFDDLPLGSHGTHYEFERWHVNANGGLVAIESAPGGMSRQALAIHMDPTGNIHQLTPQYAICPRIRTSLYMRASAVAGHRATVSMIYINREDMTFRTVSKTINLSQSAQRVVFDAVNDVARDTEYVSHIRVINQNNTLISTVFYDDITFE